MATRRMRCTPTAVHYLCCDMDVFLFPDLHQLTVGYLILTAGPRDVIGESDVVVSL